MQHIYMYVDLVIIFYKKIDAVYTQLVRPYMTHRSDLRIIVTRHIWTINRSNKNGTYVYLIESEHTDGVGHGGGQGWARLTGVIGRNANIRQTGDAWVNSGKSAGEVIGIAATKDPKISCILLIDQVSFFV
jgi:hypothetical protein